MTRLQVVESKKEELRDEPGTVNKSTWLSILVLEYQITTGWRRYKNGKK